jgi:transposase-like protein
MKCARCGRSMIHLGVDRGREIYHCVECDENRFQEEFKSSNVQEPALSAVVDSSSLTTTLSQVERVERVQGGRGDVEPLNR